MYMYTAYATHKRTVAKIFHVQIAKYQNCNLSRKLNIKERNGINFILVLLMNMYINYNLTVRSCIPDLK